jgi:predicted MFS family arabinose efflux permease
MVANIAAGAGYSAFIALLIPPYISEVTGDITASGVVMAVISLAAVLGPVLGTFADRYRAHRIVLSGGVLGLAVGFAAFAFSSESAAFYALDAILLGVAMAAVSAVGPVFVVGAGLGRELEAKRMTWFSLSMPAGQVIGGVLVGAASSAGWSYTARFWLASATMLVLFVATVATTKKPQRTLHDAMDAGEAARVRDGDRTTQTASLRAVLISTFGVFLAVTTLASIAMNGINNQISNIMPQLYGISEADTSTLIAAAGLLNIVLFIPAGRLMATRGSFTVYTIGVAMRVAGPIGMAIAGLIANTPVLLAIASMQLLYQSNSFVRLAQPSSAVSLASFSPSIANGWLIAGSAIGAAIGSALGGVLADAYGFNAVNWMGAGAGTAALLILLVGLRHGRTSGGDVTAAANPPTPAAGGSVAT